MKMPGFTAELSMYESKGHYCTTGAVVQVEGRIFPELSMISPEALTSSTFVNYRKTCDGGTNGGCLSDYNDSFGVDIGWAARSDTLVIPMSVPGHKTDLSGKCSACLDLCVWGVGAGCTTAGYIGCGFLIPIPFVGPALFAGCVETVNATCAAITELCVSNCKNIGSPCCPVACGVSCCDSSETCLDTGLGLCCSSGMLPCPGPQESCYDPRTEKCLPTGVGCPFGQECGNICCPNDLTCKEGVCCRPGQRVCNGVCCDGPCDQNGDCCPAPDSRLCPGSGVCCPGLFECCNGQCCDLGQHCHPTLGTCCSTICGQACCKANEFCQNGLCGGCLPGQQACSGQCCPPDKCCVGDVCLPKSSPACTPR